MPKRVDENTRKEIIRLFFDGNSLRMIAKEVGLARATVQGIVRHFRRTGWIRSDKSSGRRRLKSTQEILQKPSLTAKEIRMSLLRENICVQENLPSVRMVHHIMKSDLNYSFKKISQTPTEQVTERNMERILQYIDTVSQLDPQTLHFFDETGVKRTTPNRNHDYGHSLRGQKAVEFQRYA
ncbi:paired box protein Pax-6-like [Saccoglossus kowalevskii]|uniref:Paired box protein Pax-6-like n=1 Tax=Saccoglossus kowalevskii TaxID=10224 RepID=A0ABM0MB78_SACKO|nr:PREDICTED: paired box protein Pax-6-like [Saccoglossus kowalevskii]